MRTVAAISWTEHGLRVARGTWRAGRLSGVTVEHHDPAELPAFGPDTAVAVVLPPTAAGRRVVTLPFRPGRALDDVVALETRGSLPTDPGPLRVVWEALPQSGRDATRVAVAFTREETIRVVAETLGRAGGTALRIDAAPIPAWSLVDDPRGTALVVRDREASWLTAAAGHRPLLSRVLYADPDDGAALATEIARALAAWGAEPSRILIAGAGADAIREALAAAQDARCEVLTPPAALNGALDDDPVLAGALLAAARRSELPLALVAPAAVPRGQRRRLRRLVAAATVLAALLGTLTRVALARRADALEASIAAVAAEALARPDGGASYERLEAAVGALPAAPTIDPAIVRFHEIVSHLPAAPAVDLRHLRLEADRVEVGGHVGTFDAVETLRRALARSARLAAVSIADMRARIDGAGVEFRIEARWLRPGERPS